MPIDQEGPPQIQFPNIGGDIRNGLIVGSIIITFGIIAAAGIEVWGNPDRHLPMKVQAQVQQVPLNLPSPPNSSGSPTP
jgi:hypothetical protein